MEKQGRGQLTQRVQQKAIEVLSRTISVRELRLLPYIQYTLMNSQKLCIKHLNSEEQSILSSFVKDGYILEGVTEDKGRPKVSEGVKLKVSQYFWSAINEILWLAYVDLND